MQITSPTYACFFSLILFSATVYAAPTTESAFRLHSDHLQYHFQGLRSSPAASRQPVTVILETSNLDSRLRQIIRAHEGQIPYARGGRHELRLPLGRVQSLLEQLPSDAFLRLPYPMEAVAVTSQGVGISGAEDEHVLGNQGTGIKIGIIDMGFAGFTNSQASGDLPSLLNAMDYTDTGIGGINHGTQVAEIVHDMAPGAELYLAKVSTSLQLQQAVNDMMAAGVKVINHSVAWYGAAFYDGTGFLCDITTQAESAGILWVNAAGNSRTKHYLATFTDASGDLRHEFSSGQNYNAINLTTGGSVTLVLNWDAYPVTNIDYNLYLYNGDPAAGGTLVASSADRQSGNASSIPYEAITYTASVAGTYYVVISKSRSSTPNVSLTLFSIGPDLSVRNTASSLPQPADCASVLTVGATNLTDGAESFSSEGPTVDGRLKPEISAPDRVVTSLGSSFAGTSAASPHAAGAAALVLGRNPAYSISALRNTLINDSHDVSVAGFDYRTGFGRISMDADGDGINHDDDNCLLVSNIDQADLDNDGVGNTCDDDMDGDGLSNSQEIAIGTSTMLWDSDTDGLSDGIEVNVLGTNPLLWDSDGDGLSDANDPLPMTTNYADGDLAPLSVRDGMIDIADYVILQRILLGDITPTVNELSHGDIFPPGAPDGVLDMSDLLLLQQRILQ